MRTGTSCSSLKDMRHRMRINSPWIIVFIQTFLIILILFWDRDDLRQMKNFSRPSFMMRNSRLSRLERLSNYDEYTITRIERLISRKALARDPEVIELVKELVDPPSTSHTLKLSRSVYKTPQAEVVDDYLGQKRGGFYIEVGAYEGERSSNSLFFEANMAWNGLLIEADPFFYTQLLGKNRRAWSINACLSPTSYVSKFQFKGSDTGQGKLELEKSKNQSLSLFSEVMIIPCFPLESLLIALGVEKVDFFSLDVEGLELDILKTIDLRRFDITALAVEFEHGNKSAYGPLMEENGYKLVKEIHVADRANYLFAHDFIFAKPKNGST